MLRRTITNNVELTHIEEICYNIIFLCNKQSLKSGVSIHTPILKLCLQDNLHLNNNLLSLYSKCYGVQNARHFFDEMPYKDVVSWTTMLSAYTKHSHHESTLELFSFMNFSNEFPNEYTLSSVLRSCAAMRDFRYGCVIHGVLIKHGLDCFRVLSTSLVDLYSKCGCIQEAYKIFVSIDNGDTISWTTMISSFVESGKYVQAMEIFRGMIRENVTPNEFTFVKLLSACSFLGVKFAKLIHSQLVVWGAQMNLVLKTALVDVYAKCKRMEDALKVSKLSSEQDVMLWTSIITGFSQNSKIPESINAFQEMMASGVVPNSYTYNGILSACSSARALRMGKQIHSRVIVAGLDDDSSVGNALIDMYMKCSDTIEYALRVFKRIRWPNIISWTSLIAGLAEHGLQDESFEAFEEMRFSGVRPNSFTLSTIIRACGTTRFPNHIKNLHGYIIKINAGQDLVVGNALIDAYAGSGMVENAWTMVRSMSARDAITYTSLASRLNQIGGHKEALSVIKEMNDNDIEMDGFSLATFLSASVSLTAIQIGKQLHCYSVKSGLGSCLSVSNCLIDFYGKLRFLEDAQKAFAEIHVPDAISWNSLISTMVCNGKISSALSAFEDMRLAGIRPDSFTLLAILYACGRHGLIDMGLDYFHSLTKSYDIEPELAHYVCLVDLLGKAGWLEEATSIIETMPSKPNSLIYKTLLGACRIHGNVPLGEDMARRGLEFDPSDPAFNVLLAHMYDDAGRADLSEKVRSSMRDKELSQNLRNDSTNVMNNINLSSRLNEYRDIETHEHSWISNY